MRACVLFFNSLMVIFSILTAAPHAYLCVLSYNFKSSMVFFFVFLQLQLLPTRPLGRDRLFSKKTTTRLSTGHLCAGSQRDSGRTSLGNPPEKRWLSGPPPQSLPNGLLIILIACGLIGTTSLMIAQRALLIPRMGL